MLLRRIIDVSMTVLLILLMSLQVTEQEYHEYIGMVMVILVIIHQYLNRKWFISVFRGKYSPVRILSVVIDAALLIAFALSAISGMIIAETFTFMNFESLTAWARTTHIASSYWSFVLMGLHVGLHWNMVAGRIKSSWPKVIALVLAAYGLYAFIQSDIITYMFLINQFVFIDYDKHTLLVFLDNIAMLIFWCSVSYYVSKLIRRVS